MVKFERNNLGKEPVLNKKYQIPGDDLLGHLDSGAP